MAEQVEKLFKKLQSRRLSFEELEAETLVEMYKSPAPSCLVLHSRPFLSFDTFHDEITHLLR